MSKSRPCAIFAHRVPAGDVAAHESLVKVWPSLGPVAPMRMRPPSKLRKALSSTELVLVFIRFDPALFLAIHEFVNRLERVFVQEASTN